MRVELNERQQTEDTRVKLGWGVSSFTCLCLGTASALGSSSVCYENLEKEVSVPQLVHLSTSTGMVVFVCDVNSLHTLLVKADSGMSLSAWI
jgi:hypothetical protein